MPRREDILYIEDALEAIDAVQSYIIGISFDEFKNDRKTFSATIREYIIIGEAIGQLMQELEREIPDFPWRVIKDFRNIIVHEYFGVDAEMVWDISTGELTVLKSNLIRFKSFE